MDRFPVDTAEAILALAFASLVFILTAAKRWQTYRQCREISKKLRISLSTVLLHEGVLAHACCIGL